MLRHPLCQDASLVLGIYLIYKFQGGLPPFVNRDADPDKIIVPRRRTVTALHLANREEEALFLHFRIAYAACADIFTSGSFKKMQILRIIHNPHAVGFAV